MNALLTSSAISDVQLETEPYAIARFTSIHSHPPLYTEDPPRPLTTTSHPPKRHFTSIFQALTFCCGETGALDVVSVRRRHPVVSATRADSSSLDSREPHLRRRTLTY
ncbi:hypothetical protein FOMPIDRAFT_1021651 [Fomitopsis schrenkii]|uniref:Uncharacterized protein n=1 Tax=Fomitopsis schrenkii TaxID=2126942 RepID=S8G3I3_FOMSC|nr:hypothetical protein FOMPIDRAFT_1021651 [Fomitopsis schrenkii]